VPELFKLIREVRDSAGKRITTGELNRFVESLQFEERKIYYITQASARPPTFVLFTDRAGPLHFSHERYLINQLRRRFGFKGTPIVLKSKVKKKSGRRGGRIGAEHGSGGPERAARPCHKVRQLDVQRSYAPLPRLRALFIH